MIKLLFMIYQKTGSFFFFIIWCENYSLSFNFACSAVSLLNHTMRRGFTLFHRGPEPVISQLPYLRPKFTVQGLYAPLYSPCGSAPPLLSLTRIASILALVKLTSSLNYANKAVVICICTAQWHVVLGVGGGIEEGWGGEITGGIYSCDEGS